MKRLTNEELMDYMDGTLSAARLAEIEQHLASSPEDAELVADLKMAQKALIEWDEAEPVRAGEDFWPKLRDKLPAQPGRNPLRALGSRLSGWLWPAHSRMGMSLRVAVVAAVLAIAAAMFAPQQTKHQVIANNGSTVTSTLTPEDRSFIRKSLERHSAYESSQPWAGAVPPATRQATGDVNSADRVDDDEVSDSRVP